MNTSHVLKKWNYQSAAILKPKLTDACDVIASLCSKIDKLEIELKSEKSRQDSKEQEYKTMILEVQNVVSKYA